MGGFFGAVKKTNAMVEVFFGTDYHSHLGTRSGGLACYDPEEGFSRKIHGIGNSPFRTKFDGILSKMHGTAGIGCINDTNPQPLVVCSQLGIYAVCFTGVIRNKRELVEKYITQEGSQLSVMSDGHVNTTELIAALINRFPSFEEGISRAQDMIDGTALILLLTDRGTVIAARDRDGRLPVHIGRNGEGHCVSFEQFAYEKLGYESAYELGPGEIVEIYADHYEILKPENRHMQVCSFLWTYYGFPTSEYEDMNVELMRYRNGEIMAQNDIDAGTLPDVDYVAGVPDSGTPHAIGYANRSHIPFSRPFIKYTPTWPRSFMPPNQKERNEIAKMKQIPVRDLIEGKNLLFVDDSIVRGTQLRETVDFLYENGAKAVHIRSACPPIMYACKFLNFSRETSDMELITRRTILELEGEKGFHYLDEYADGSTKRGRELRDDICRQLHIASVEFQTIEGLTKAIGLETNKLCTYCWNGRD
ncbi:MAG: amidophosphoribosyltransferase [Lachnospiraceae bacterium]|nr:amidophosphoribosyltransferase [Lachnospiraceae bacterium]